MDYAVTQEQMKSLLERFNQRIEGFTDFLKPGENFVRNELEYKRRGLDRFQKELGREGLRQLLTSGEGQKALSVLSKAVQLNLVQYNSWRQSFGESDEKATAILSSFLTVSEGPYQGPQTLAPLFGTIGKVGLKPAWDTMSTTLWALQPKEYFPVKISHFRDLANELDMPLPEGRPTPEAYDAVMRFGKTFRDALKQYNPSDWIDVQAFIWVVCPNSYDGKADQIAITVANIRKDHITEKRISTRLAAEEEAKELLDSKIGHLSEEDLKRFFVLVNTDYWKGTTTHDRFGLAYVGYNIKVLLSQLDAVNEWISKFWHAPEKELAGLLDTFHKDRPLKNAGSAFPSLILYLRDPLVFNLCFKKMEERLSAITGFKEKGHNGKYYFNYNSKVNELKEKYELFPQEVDIVLTVDGGTVVKPDYSLTKIATETGIGEIVLERWIRAIERKGQAVLYGPPGTGKTYVAERLARSLIGGGDGFVDLVQFHPAYAYEDFVQGIRPQARADGCLEYPVVPGRFLHFCKKAEERKHKCVLIIDEINRANLSRVFGELMYLLEYRDKKIPLASGGTFSIPSNVRIIGTMNTADRSIALVDHALRRRFAFLALYPNYDVLRKYHKENDFDAAPLIGVLERLNKQIGDRHFEIGISFFLTAHLNESIDDIWRMEIEPYLEEYFFDQPDKVETFRWEKVGKEILP